MAFSATSTSAARRGALARPGALLAARAVSAVGDYATALALPLVALALTHDARVLALALAVEGAPVMLAPWWTQRLPDSWRQPRRLPVIGILQALAAAALPVAIWVADLETSGLRAASVILAVALALGTFNALAGALGSAALCDLAERHTRGGAPRILSLDDLTGRVARLTGPALAAALAAAWDPVTVLAFDAATFLLAVPLASWALRSPAADEREPERRSDVPLRRPEPASGPSRRRPRLLPVPIRRLLAAHPDVAAAWRLRGIGCFVWGGYAVGVPLLVVAIPGRDASQLAVVTGAYAAATLVGSAAISARPVRPQRLLAAAVLAWSVVGGCFIAMAAGATLIVLAASAAVMGLSVPMANVTTTQQVAAAASGSERTLAMMTQSSIVNGSSTAGLVVTGAVIAALGPRATLACAGAIVLLAAMLSIPKRPTSKAVQPGINAGQIR